MHADEEVHLLEHGIPETRVFPAFQFFPVSTCSSPRSHRRFWWAAAFLCIIVLCVLTLQIFGDFKQRFLYEPEKIQQYEAFIESLVSTTSKPTVTLRKIEPTSAPALQHVIQNSSEPLVPDALVDYVPGTGPRIDTVYKASFDDLFDPWLDEVRADRSWLSDINRADDVWPRSNTTLLFYSCYFPDNQFEGEADLYARNLKFFLRHGVFHDHDPLYPAEYHFLFSFDANSLHNASSISSLFDLVSGGTLNSADRIVYTHLLDNPGVDITAYSRLIRELGQSYVNKFTYFGAMNCGARGPLLNLTSVDGATDISSALSSSSSARVSKSSSASIPSSSPTCKVHAHFLPHYVRRLGVYGRSFVAQTGARGICNEWWVEDHIQSWAVFYHRIAFPVLYRQWQEFFDKSVAIADGEISGSIRVNRLGWFVSSDDFLPFRNIRGLEETNCERRESPFVFTKYGGEPFRRTTEPQLYEILERKSAVHDKNFESCQVK